MTQKDLRSVEDRRREIDGNPSTIFFTLEKYAEHAPEGAAFILKAPAVFQANGHRFLDCAED